LELALRPYTLALRPLELALRPYTLALRLFTLILRPLELALRLLTLGLRQLKQLLSRSKGCWNKVQLVQERSSDASGVMLTHRS